MCVFDSISAVFDYEVATALNIFSNGRSPPTGYPCHSGLIYRYKHVSGFKCIYAIVCVTVYINIYINIITDNI